MKNDESFVHSRDNNKESQQHLEDNEQHFNKQCLDILALFKKGVVLTQKIGMVEYDIGDTRRRISELRKGGITGIVDEWIKDEQGNITKCKKWYMPEFLNSSPAPKQKKEKKASTDYSKELIKSTKKKVIVPVNQQPLNI